MAHQLELQHNTLKILAHGIPTVLDLRLAHGHAHTPQHAFIIEELTRVIATFPRLCHHGLVRTRRVY